jgi:hypothetical protein
MQAPVEGGEICEMTIVHCPRCRDEVTVPAKASPRALVRCPLCLEEYLLAEALAEMPPALLIVGDEMDEEPALVGAGTAAAEAGGYGEAGGFGGGVFDSSAPAGAAVAPARTAVKSGARPRRKEKSALGEMVKIVLGGVVGLSIGLLVLWWGLRKDPLKLGPKVSPYAPWIVPAEFRHTPTEAGTTVQNNATSNSNNSSNLTVPGPAADGSFQAAPQASVATNSDKGTSGNSLQTLPDPLAVEPGPINPVAPASIDVPSLDPVPTTPESNPPATASSENGNAKPPSTPPPAVDFTNLLPDGDTPAPTPESNPKPPVEPAPENPPAATAADLATAVQAANDALAAVEAGKNEPKEVRQQLFTDLYLAAADAGRILSHLDPADADVADPLAQLKRFGAELAAQPGKVSAFGHLGRTHLPERKDGEGFAVAGKVIAFRAAGSVFETTLDAGSGVEVLLISTGNPQDFCKVDDQLLVTGRIVREPIKNIPGYEDQAERVLLLGDAAVVPKAE